MKLFNGLSTVLQADIQWKKKSYIRKYRATHCFNLSLVRPDQKARGEIPQGALCDFLPTDISGNSAGVQHQYLGVRRKKGFWPVLVIMRRAGTCIRADQGWPSRTSGA